MIKTKFKKDFVTLNDVLTFIKSDEWGDPTMKKL